MTEPQAMDGDGKPKLPGETVSIFAAAMVTVRVKQMDTTGAREKRSLIFLDTF